jgi:hypothetical protein
MVYPLEFISLDYYLVGNGPGDTVSISEAFNNVLAMEELKAIFGLNPTEYKRVKVQKKDSPVKESLELRIEVLRDTRCISKLIDDLEIQGVSLKESSLVRDILTKRLRDTRCFLALLWLAGCNVTDEDIVTIAHCSFNCRDMRYQDIDIYSTILIREPRRESPLDSLRPSLAGKGVKIKPKILNSYFNSSMSYFYDFVENGLFKVRGSLTSEMIESALNRWTEKTGIVNRYSELKNRIPQRGMGYPEKEQGHHNPVDRMEEVSIESVVPRQHRLWGTLWKDWSTNKILYYQPKEKDWNNIIMLEKIKKIFNVRQVHFTEVKVKTSIPSEPSFRVLKLGVEPLEGVLVASEQRFVGSDLRATSNHFRRESINNFPGPSPSQHRLVVEDIRKAIAFQWLVCLHQIEAEKVMLCQEKISSPTAEVILRLIFAVLVTVPRFDFFRRQASPTPEEPVELDLYVNNWFDGDSKVFYNFIKEELIGNRSVDDIRKELSALGEKVSTLEIIDGICRRVEFLESLEPKGSITTKI